jgi:hypothetical protein
MIPNGPQKTPFAQGLAERAARSASSVRKDAAKTNARGEEAVNLFDRYLRIGQKSPLQVLEVVRSKRSGRFLGDPLVLLVVDGRGDAIGEVADPPDAVRFHEADC